MYVCGSVDVLYCCSVTKLCLTLCHPMNCSTPCFFTISKSLLKLMSIELMMPSSHLTLCHPFLLLSSVFPSIRVFPMSQLFVSHGQNIGASASLSVSSVAQSYPALCNPKDCCMPAFLVHHQLPELAQTHVHRVGDAIQSSHPLLSPSPSAFSLSQLQGLSQ